MKKTVVVMLVALCLFINMPIVAVAKPTPKITHEFVEQLIQQWQVEGLNSVLSAYDFHYNELQLIKIYAQDNQTGWSNKFDQSVLWESWRIGLIKYLTDILGELKYDKIIDGIATAIAYCGPEYRDGYLLFIKLADGSTEKINVDYESTIFDATLNFVDHASPTVPLNVYVIQDSGKWQAVKIVVARGAKLDNKFASMGNAWHSGLMHYDEDNTGQLQPVRNFDVNLIAVKDYGTAIGADLLTKLSNGREEIFYVDYQLTLFNEEWNAPNTGSRLFSIQAIRDNDRWRVVNITPQDDLNAGQQPSKNYGLSEEQIVKLRQRAIRNVYTP